MENALLVQYQVLSQQRLHFGRLYWQSVAFLFVLLFGIFAVFTRAHFLPVSISLFFMASITLLMGFVAERLRLLERRYEDALEAIERTLQESGTKGIQIAPKSGKRGARFVITLGLFALGGLISLTTILNLLGLVTL